VGMIPVPIHVLDFEGSRQSGIVEYGLVTLRAGRIEGTETRLCRATGTISDGDRLQHGISEAAVAGSEPFEADWELFAGLRESGPFCAHHAAVEDGLLRAVWAYGRRSPDFSEEGLLTSGWGPWLDTLPLYRRVYPNLESYKLGDLVTLFELEGELESLADLHCPVRRARYHCALYDALASALLLKRLLELPELEAVSLRWLLQQSASSEAGREAMGQGELF